LKTLITWITTREKSFVVLQGLKWDTELFSVQKIGASLPKADSFQKAFPIIERSNIICILLTL
jgi:hypothetical protein